MHARPPEPVSEAAPARVSIVVPAYNEEAAIGGVLAELRALGPGYELVVVDDGSTDATAERARPLADRLVRHARNRGYGAACKSGLRAAGGEVIVFFDADGQHRPADVPRVVEALDGGAELAVGARRNRAAVAPGRAPGKLVLELLARLLLGTRPPDLNCGLRAARRSDLLRVAHLLPSGFSCSTTMTFAFEKAGREVRYVPIEVGRRVGRSTVRPIRDGVGTALLMVRLTTLFDPLKVFLPPALLLGLGGIASGAHDVLFGTQGLADTTVLLLLSALILFFFGLLADQVAALRRERIET